MSEREVVKSKLVEFGLRVVRATNDNVIFASQPRAEVELELNKLAEEYVAGIIEAFRLSREEVVPTDSWGVKGPSSEPAESSQQPEPAVRKKQKAGQ
jgi:hypothetical protein